MPYSYLSLESFSIFILLHVISVFLCRFSPPKQETFFKDDANHDPQWSEEQIVSAKFELNGLQVGE